MEIKEFEKRTGYFPTTEEYKTIEKFYMNFDGGKDEFCEAYKKNEGFIAEKIQHEANLERLKSDSETSEKNQSRARRNRKIKKRFRTRTRMETIQRRRKCEPMRL